MSALIYSVKTPIWICVVLLAAIAGLIARPAPKPELPKSETADGVQAELKLRASLYQQRATGMLAREDDELLHVLDQRLAERKIKELHR
jgi:hypothetical protein